MANMSFLKSPLVCQAIMAGYFVDNSVNTVERLGFSPSFRSNIKSNVPQLNCDPRGSFLLLQSVALSKLNIAAAS